MCFTVAILREGVLLTAQQYYENLPDFNPEVPDFPDMFMVSGFSHPFLPVITEKEISLCEWGLVPSWIKSIQSANEISTKTLNAMSETIFEKPSFRQNIISRRCLLPLTGFYEWRDVNGVKYPYFISASDNNNLLLGSIYDFWTNPQTGEVKRSLSIVTTPANSMMAEIHNLKKRMPLILTKKDSLEWLDSKTEKSKILNLMKPFPDNKMRAYTISRSANNTQSNRNVPDIMKVVTYTELKD